MTNYKATLNPILLAAVVLCAVVLTGCGRSPAVKFYTLSPAPVVAEQAGPDLSLAIGPAEFPRYLNRKQIVTRLSKSQIRVDEYNVWSASLEAGFLGVVGDNLTSRLGTVNLATYPAEPAFAIDYRILFDITDFEGVLGESVSLKARWTIVRPQGSVAIAAGVFQHTEVIENNDKSYDALVLAYSAAIGKLSDVITDRLVELGNPVVD